MTHESSEFTLMSSLSTTTATTMKTPPRRFEVSDSFSPAEVQEALYRDGAVILTGLSPDEDKTTSTWASVAANVPHLVWASPNLLLHKHRADGVHVEHERLSLSGQALLPHTDGYIWGDCYPDLVILVCEQPAGGDEEGANFLIDGHAVVARLKDTTRKFLEETLVDHTEREGESFAQGAESIVPLLRYLDPKGWQTKIPEESNQKRLCWRRMISKQYAGSTDDSFEGDYPYISLWTAPAGMHTAGMDEALHEIDRVIAAEAREALRFPLKAGEALLVDNFRLLHAREAFPGKAAHRRMWRVWGWTDASMGLPPEIAAANGSSEGTLPAANILEAEQAILANDAGNS